MPAPNPPHRVQRLLLDLAGMPAGDAPALQAAAQRQLQQHLVPLLDALCTRLGDPRQVQRIDRLEIDLGAWPADAWAADGDAAAALRQQFEHNLTRQLSDALQQASTVQTDAELVASCLHAGHLPWWADAADRGQLQRALDTLLAGPVQPGLAWLPPPDADAPALQRLVAALADAPLAGLASRLQGLPDAPMLDWARLLAAIAHALGHSPRALRQAWWREALAAALHPGAAQRPAWADALQRLPARLGVETTPLAAAWRRALDQVAPAGEAAALAPLWRAIDAVWPASRAVAPAAGDASAAATTLAALVATLQRRPADDPMRAWLPWLGQLQHHLRPDTARRLAAALSSGHTAAAANVLQTWLAEVPVPAGSPPSMPSAPGVEALAALLAVNAASPAPAAGLAPPAAPQLPPAEALYLANAGLVLVWPFVPQLADRLGLLEARQFRSPAHAVRLAVLLQCVATGDLEPPEFQLPLNKLLCGLPLDMPMDLDTPITPDEQDECQGLLAAVLQAAPGLGNISVDGLRQAFLQRPGALRMQDGHWLLQVERATHDVLLGRIPWATSIVRLPWMPRLLQVQW